MVIPRHSSKRPSSYSTPSRGRAFLRIASMPPLVSKSVLSKSKR